MPPDCSAGTAGSARTELCSSGTGPALVGSVARAGKPSQAIPKIGGGTAGQASCFKDKEDPTCEKSRANVVDPTQEKDLAGTNRPGFTKSIAGTRASMRLTPKAGRVGPGRPKECDDSSKPVFAKFEANSPESS